MAPAKIRFSAITRSPWYYQLIALSKIEWTQAKNNWLDASWKNKAAQMIFLGLLLLPGSFIFGSTIKVLPVQFIVQSLPMVLTPGFLLLFSMLALQAPTKLWAQPDLQWYFSAPLPIPLLLARPALSMMKSMILLIIPILFFMFILIVFWHASFAVFALLFIGIAYEIIVCTFAALVSILMLTLWFGIKRVHFAVIGASSIISIPALLVLISLFAPKVTNIQGLPLIAYLQQPVAILVAMIWKLLTAASTLTPSEIVILLMVVFLLPLLLIVSYVWLGTSMYQRVWEGLQHSGGEVSSSTLTTKPHPVWELAWHLPALSPSQNVIIGYCWQDMIRNWADLPTIIVYFLIGVVSQIVPLLNSGNVQEYRDLLPLIGIFILLGENQFILLTIGKSLMSRLMKGDWLLQATAVTAREVFNAICIAILLPIVFIWTSMALIICVVLGLQPLAIVITLVMLALGLTAIVPAALSMSIFSAHHGYQFGIMVPTWIVSMSIVLCISMMTTFLLFPTLPVSLQSNLGQFGNQVFHVTLSSLQQGIVFGICLIAIICIIVLVRFVGIARLRRDIASA